MAAAYQLEIQGDSSNFTFDIEGSWFPRLEAEYKLAANPPEIIGLREVWEIRGARLTSGAGAQATAVAALWTKFVALRSRVAVRGTAHPTYARFVIPGGATLHTLGPSTHEGFVIESLSGDLDAQNPAASWRSTGTITIVVSAVQRFADTNGIVGWEQTVDSSYPEGRHRLEWRTRITTLEGTSAATKARTYAAINAAALGTTYLYETGGTTGAVDIVEQDADQQNTRTATVCEAVSRVRAYGTTIGSVTAGASPTDLSYSITTRTSADETSTTTFASAVGPNALSFVLSKAPAVFNEREVVDEQAKMTASGTWTQRDKRVKDPKDKVTASLKTTIAGGQRAVDFEPVADGGEPVEFVGAFLPVVGVAEIEIDAVGNALTMADMPLPGPPGDPWRFDAQASTESEPSIKSLGADASQNTWTRSARLVFRAAKFPTSSLFQSMVAANTVPSHFYA